MVYLIISIIVIIVLVVLFMVSFVLYKKTPAPKGCENLLINEENCMACSNQACAHKKKEQ